jgi:hypothetical protein
MFPETLIRKMAGRSLKGRMGRILQNGKAFGKVPINMFSS